MTPIAIKLALAKMLPEQIVQFDQEEFTFRWKDLGDLVTDHEWLYVVHECEKFLTREQLVDYCNFRLRYTTGEGNVTDYKMITATFDQRAEALLRTLGLWEEE